MSKRAAKRTVPRQITPGLPKARTGIDGLDRITGGGLPRARPTLVCGGTGCGKTLLAMEFLARGAAEYHEPGVFVSFGELPEHLEANVSSLGFRLKDLQARDQLAIDYVHVERSEIQETGQYNLEGLFIRLNSEIERVKARRIAFDTLESLFAGLKDHAILRAELRRLFKWLSKRGISSVITAERGEGALTRHALEAYLADCVILLDNRVADEVTTRLLRVVKYRGSAHGTNEFPFLIRRDGLSILPITSVGLDFGAPREHVSTGIARLNTMLGGKGYYRGSYRHHGGRQDHGGRQLRELGLPRGPSMHIPGVRGIGRAVDTQHAFGRHRSGTVGRQRTAYFSCHAIDFDRPGRTSAHDGEHGCRGPARSRGTRPDNQPDFDRDAGAG